MAFMLHSEMYSFEMLIKSVKCFSVAELYLLGGFLYRNCILPNDMHSNCSKQTAAWHTFNLSFGQRICYAIPNLFLIMLLRYTICRIFHLACNESRE